MLDGFNFGLACSDPAERDLATRIYYRLAKIEQEMRGHKLCEGIACLDEVTFEEQYILTGLVYYPHPQHIDDLVIVIVNDLSDISPKIEMVSNADIKILLREYYHMLKEELCKHDGAQAYYWGRKRRGI